VPFDSSGLEGFRIVIPGRVEDANLRRAIARRGTSRFPDAQLRICRLVPRTIPE
jgi:hypothetical protein